MAVIVYFDGTLECRDEIDQEIPLYSFLNLTKLSKNLFI